jgi:hypothetical protein
MKTDANLTFPHDYEVEVPTELPSGQGDAMSFYFPGGKQNGGHDGVLVKITPSKNATPWFGIFSFGETKDGRINGIFSCPERTKLCVVAAGRGYVVSASSPPSTYEIPALPITDVRVSLENELLLFADFTKIVAIGKGGLTWKSERLSWDGVQISGVDSRYVWGQGWDPARSSFTEFKLDLKDGHSIP